MQVPEDQAVRVQSKVQRGELLERLSGALCGVVLCGVNVNVNVMCTLLFFHFFIYFFPTGTDIGEITKPRPYSTHEVDNYPFRCSGEVYA